MRDQSSAVNRPISRHCGHRSFQGLRSFEVECKGASLGACLNLLQSGGERRSRSRAAGHASLQVQPSLLQVGDSSRHNRPPAHRAPSLRVSTRDSTAPKSRVEPWTGQGEGRGGGSKLASVAQQCTHAAHSGSLRKVRPWRGQGEAGQGGMWERMAAIACGHASGSKCSSAARQ